jgi:hypothetical protein
MAEPEVKAQAFLSRIDALRAMLSTDELETLLTQVPPDVAELVRHPPLAMTWVDARKWARLIADAHRLSFKGDDVKVMEWGRNSMSRDLNTVFRALLSLASPLFMAKRATSMFDQLNRNNGTMQAVALGDKGVDVFYQGLVSANPSFWVFQTGLIDSAARVTGSKGIKTERVAGGGNSQDCTIRVTWQ